MSKLDRKTITIILGVTFFVFMLGLIIGILKEVDENSGGNSKLIGIPSPVESELSKLVVRYKNGELDNINASDATTFSWDKLYIFGSYTEPREIDSVAGRSWRKIVLPIYNFPMVLLCWFLLIIML